LTAIASAGPANPIHSQLKENMKDQPNNLADLIGGCFADSAYQCVWRCPVTQTDIAERLFPGFQMYVKKVRKLTPCYCVLNERRPVCIDCPLILQDDEAKKDLEEIKLSARIGFLYQIQKWPEFDRMRDIAYAILIIRTNQALQIRTDDLD
jgi:hypothetical protein